MGAISACRYRDRPLLPPARPLSERRHAGSMPDSRVSCVRHRGDSTHRRPHFRERGGANRKLISHQRVRKGQAAELPISRDSCSGALPLPGAAEVRCCANLRAVGARRADDRRDAELRIPAALAIGKAFFSEDGVPRVSRPRSRRGRLRVTG